LVGTLYGISNFVLLDGFAQVETTDAIRNAQRVNDAINGTLDSLNVKVNDWAAWDDAYKFIQDGNEEFRKSNLSENALPNLKIDILLYIDTAGKVIGQLANDEDNHKPAEFPEGLLEHFKPGQPLVTFADLESFNQGIVMLKNGPMRIATRPVVTSEKKGPIKGTLAFGRFLSTVELERLAKLTHLDLKVARLDQDQLPEPFNNANSNISEKNPIHVMRKNDNEISSFAILKDIYGKPGLIIETNMDRSIYQVGQGSMNKLIYAILTVGLLFGLLIFVLLETTVVKRLLNLSESVSNIGSSGEISQRVQESGNDEITKLSHSINGMLQSIETSTKQINEANKTISTMLNTLGQGFIMFNRQGVISSIHSQACDSLLETNPANKILTDVLKLDKGSLDEWIEYLFTEPIAFESLTAIGPQFYKHSAGLQVKLQYHAIRNQDKAVESIVAIATDITAEVNARKEADRQKQMADLILKIVKTRDEFLNFVDETKRIFRELKVMAHTQSQLDIPAIYRAVHTIKGGAGAFSVTSLQNMAHEYESELSVLKESGNIAVESVNTLEEKIIHLEKTFDNFLNEHKEVIGPSIVDGDRRVEIPISKLKTFAQRLPQNISNENIRHDFIRELIAQPIYKSFQHYDGVIGPIADKLEKMINKIQFINGDIPILQDHYNELFSSLVHAFRNAIDHGIEMPDIRDGAGKELEGSIIVTFNLEQQGSANQKWLTISVKDDGGGINASRIREKLREKGYKNWDTEIDHQCIQHVFDSGLSTAQQVTETSGRGVGMDAIANAAKKMGGTAEVFSTLGKGSETLVRVPYLLDVISETQTTLKVA
jgi:two-component system chemotaxis sensor kinase CheA